MCRGALSDGISATTRIPTWADVGDSPAYACDLEAFLRLRIEVNPGDCAAGNRCSDVPVAARGQHLQGPYRVHSADVWNSSMGERRGPRRRTGGPSIRAPVVGPLVAATFLLRVTASVTIGAAVVVLVKSAVETIVITATVFARIGDSRLRRERQNDGARGDGDRELQRLLLVFLKT